MVIIYLQVAWLKNGVKFFEYINGRVPPYRNFSDVVTGAEIDVSNIIQLEKQN